MLSCLLPVWEFVCTQLLPAALLLSVSLPCCLHWAGLWSEFLFSDTALPQGFTLSMLGSFSKVPCVLWLDDFTPLFLLFLTLHACRLLQSHSSAFICSFHFLPLYSWAEDTVVLHRAGPGYSSWPGALAQALALGRNLRWGRAAPVLGQPCDGSAAGISYSTLRASFWPWTHNLEIMEDVHLYLWCVICVWKFRLF